MTSYKQVSGLESQTKDFYDNKDLSLFLGLDGRNLENTIRKLSDQKIITTLEKGKYFVTSKNPNELDIAQFIYNPSYISFETALNYYGVLSQFPTTITSVTTKRTRNKIIQGKEYSYRHIDKKYFKGYIKNENFLIATPEKALVDQIYFSVKSYKSLNLDEYDMSKINKTKLLQFAKSIKGSLGIKIVRLIKEQL